MQDYDIYSDIARRTGGDIYIGVVGPVRTGKSTFITRFMEELVIPSISAKKRGVAVDEMPQSASGKTVMTTEPKFVPSEAVNVKVGKSSAKIRLIDCVGYMVKGALGGEEDGKPRLVSTPWQEEPMAFEKAAELGTQKVINDHSTIGVVITSDGSFTDLSRGEFVPAEDRVIKELKSLNKPFIVIFNTTIPNDEKTLKACKAIEEKHGVTVIAADVASLNKKGFEDILEKVLEEFPMRIFDLEVPKWIQALPLDGEIITKTIKCVTGALEKADKMKCCASLENMFADSDVYDGSCEVEADMGVGRVYMKAFAKPDVFYKALSEACGESLDGEIALMDYVKELSVAKREYAKVKDALRGAESQGYGVVCPSFADASVGEPQIVKKSGQYCVRMKVSTKSLHLIRADIATDVDAVCGSKKQCEDFVEMMEKDGFDTPVFGRPLSQVVEGEIDRKSGSLNDNVKGRIKRTLTKAVNENKSRLICLLY